MFHYLILGGPVLIPIAICSVWALALIVIQSARLREISRDSALPVSQLTPYIKKQDWLGAERLAAGSGHPFLKAWRCAFTLLSEGKSSSQDLDEAVSVDGGKMLAELESALKPLASLITVLPMLGFLGTILGLIASFQNWESMGSQVSISALAGGIYQAMITTAAGLIAAIPYSLAHHHFVAKAERVALQFSEETTKLLHLIRRTRIQTVIASPVRQRTDPSEFRRKGAWQSHSSEIASSQRLRRQSSQ
jgi:biopolymer transport protein ExbB